MLSVFSRLLCPSTGFLTLLLVYLVLPPLSVSVKPPPVHVCSACALHMRPHHPPIVGLTVVFFRERPGIELAKREAAWRRHMLKICLSWYFEYRHLMGFVFELVVV